MRKQPQSLQKILDNSKRTSFNEFTYDVSLYIERILKIINTYNTDYLTERRHNKLLHVASDVGRLVFTHPSRGIAYFPAHAQARLRLEKHLTKKNEYNYTLN